ncbi:MAG: dolichyl-phosphate beta-glucosyltransferase [Actinomycetota bacterium]|nr:dolichyl-phosphate beta-glucosyltransferase [Actinomycetota bacterium]
MLKTSISLVVPLFNEQDRFSETADETVRFIARWGPQSEVIWVDDGSSDRTVETVEAYIALGHNVETKLLRIPHRGKGAAVRAGLLSARCSFGAFCDVDLATPLDDIAGLIDICERDGGLVIGSRALPTSNVLEHESFLREQLGRAYNRVVRAFLTPGIFDTQCGAKAARNDVWVQLLSMCREDGFAADVEMIAVAMASEVPVWEIGVRWAHDNRSRVHVWKDGISMLTSLLRIWRRTRVMGDKTRFLLYK